MLASWLIVRYSFIGPIPHRVKGQMGMSYRATVLSLSINLLLYKIMNDVNRMTNYS